MRHGQRLLIGALVAAMLAVALTLVLPTGKGSWAADGILYVDAGATGGNDGSTWADAFTALQPALDAAGAGNQIWVAAGTYRPSLELSPGDPQSASFQMKNGVALYGGFDPSAGIVAFENRDWLSHPAILSGDRNGDDGPGFANNGENCYHVFNHPAGLNLDGSAVLDGFTVTGGNSLQYGGGMYNDGSSPALANCTFTANFAGWDGGGMYNWQGSSPTLATCVFKGNAANWGGGGMYNIVSSSPTLTNCTFTGNSAGLVGGGLFSDGSSPVVTNCTFAGNTAANTGGGMYNINSSWSTVTNAILWGNSPDQIQDSGQAFPITYSDIQGSYPGEGNIAADPRLVDVANGDLHIGLGSPCIDAGNNAAPNLPAVDFEGDARIIDGNDDGTAVVDMGVDEAPEGSGPPPPPAVLYVDQDATGANDGTSWESAFTDLQDALAWAVSGVQIWVAEGTYKPAAGLVRDASFQMKNGVALYGGFDPPAGIVAFENRDWVNNVTVLSGDLNGDDGPDFANNGENSYHVFYHPAGLNLDASAVLDGFTVSGGNANADYHTYGGGMFNDGSSPALANCTFVGNWAEQGGGLSNTNASPTLTNCAFAGNRAAGNGGGMFNDVGSSPTLTGCVFDGNSVELRGAGMYNQGAPATLTNCTFRGNAAGGDGGGVANVASQLTLTNCTFWGNSAVRNGGGMLNEGGEPLWPRLTNCTFAGNAARLGGAMYNRYASPALTNCILWANKRDQIVNGQSTPAVTYSDIQGGYPGEGNIALKPLFLDIDAGDLHLRPDSPCIDAGTNDAPNLPDLDFEGDARILDGNGDGLAIVDMGADEFLPEGPVPVEVEINVKPGDPDNVISLSARTVLVAVLTTGAFDAGTVNPDTVQFAGAAPLRWLIKDVDRDGDLDLLLYFLTRELALDESSTEATLTGETLDGTPIHGTDAVHVVP